MNKIMHAVNESAIEQSLSSLNDVVDLQLYPIDQNTFSWPVQAKNWMNKVCWFYPAFLPLKRLRTLPKRGIPLGIKHTLPIATTISI